MFKRTIQHPGVEIIEQDFSFSAYKNLKSYAAFIGFTSKEVKSEPVTIASVNEFIEKFGQPSSPEDYYLYCAVALSLGNSLDGQVTVISLPKAGLDNPDYPVTSLKPALAKLPNSITDLYDCGSSSVFASSKPGQPFTEYDISDDIYADRWLNFTTIFGNYCKYQNQYCMAHADGPRSLTLKGLAPRLNGNEFITADKLDSLHIGNNSYLSVNVVWASVANEFTSAKQFVPPSCLLAPIIAGLAEPWQVPAGIKYGLIKTPVFELSLNAEHETKDLLYNKCFNYASYGRCCTYLDGQKTCYDRDFQLNRINVRRLINHLKRYTIAVGQSYIGLTNNTVNRESFKDDLSVEFERCKLLGGLDSYSIKVSNDINYDLAVKDGELRVQIIVKPVSAIEFVLCSFSLYKSGLKLYSDTL